MHTYWYVYSNDRFIMYVDVKPSNILINRAGQVKLCDFGIAGELVNSFCQTDIGCKPYLAVSGQSLTCVCLFTLKHC